MLPLTSLHLELPYDIQIFEPVSLGAVQIRWGRAYVLLDHVIGSIVRLNIRQSSFMTQTSINLRTVGKS